MKSIVSIILAGILFSSCHGDLDVIQTSEVSANSIGFIANVEIVSSTSDDNP